ncbi:MAG: hypothetical protein HRU35_04085 [Rickettsiaceae bacterium]|nr:hypothetical protein [Rickettsiaceae bacterium]
MAYSVIYEYYDDEDELRKVLGVIPKPFQKNIEAISDDKKVKTIINTVKNYSLDTNTEIVMFNNETKGYKRDTVKWLNKQYNITITSPELRNIVIFKTIANDFTVSQISEVIQCNQINKLHIMDKISFNNYLADEKINNEHQNIPYSISSKIIITDTKESETKNKNGDVSFNFDNEEKVVEDKKQVKVKKPVKKKLSSNKISSGDDEKKINTNNPVKNKLPNNKSSP